MKHVRQYLELIPTQEIELPVGSRIFDLRIQAQQLGLWYSCYQHAEIVKRTINIYEEGFVPENVGKYLGSFQLHEGQLVLRAFLT